MAKNLISISELMKYIKNARQISTIVRNRVVQDIKGILMSKKIITKIRKQIHKPQRIVNYGTTETKNCKRDNSLRN